MSDEREWSEWALHFSKLASDRGILAAQIDIDEAKAKYFDQGLSPMQAVLQGVPCKELPRANSPAKIAYEPPANAKSLASIAGALWAMVALQVVGALVMFFLVGQMSCQAEQAKADLKETLEKLSQQRPSQF
jgi:hypothetical protein